MVLPLPWNITILEHTDTGYAMKNQIGIHTLLHLRQTIGKMLPKKQEWLVTRRMKQGHIISKFPSYKKVSYSK